ncbi:MAG: M28 family metallopeptidase [Hellea sp.]|nr:M28 family metallopeptidase [Hellea sp.]
MIKILTTTLTLSLMFSLTIGCSKFIESPDAVSSGEITEQDLSLRIKKLSSDNFEGRAPGTPGGIAASQYIADEMNSIGLIPMGSDGSYFQSVELTAQTLLPNSQMNINFDRESVFDGNDKKNSVYWTKRLNENVDIKSSEIVFVGYGINAPEYNWNDYSEIEVKGKTVLILINDPGFATQDETLFKGNAMTYYGRWTYKYEEAARQGASAAIIIHKTAPASYGWQVVSGSWSGEQYDLVRPDKGASRTALEGWMTYGKAEELLLKAGLKLKDLEADATENNFKALSIPRLTLSASLKQNIKTTVSRNVAGGVIGSKYPEDFVLYMAHWDHLGMNLEIEGTDKIYNGAVDNATGTAAIIEIAEAFKTSMQPERSALFLAVTAEESGLLGSAYYAEEPLVPLKNTIAGINIDAMLPLGRTKDMKVIGYGASELEDLLESTLDRRNMYIVPDDKPEAGYYYRSDHISLAKKGVPMLYADPGNEHEDYGLIFGEDFSNDYTKNRYHKPADEYNETWDLSGIKQTSEILYELGYNLANSTMWPNWYEGTEFRSLRTKMMNSEK